MAVVVKLKHVDNLSGGRKRFRRRWPKALGEDVMQVALKAREGAALVAEHETSMDQFDSMVATVMQDAEQSARLSPNERWQQVAFEATRLVEGAIGLDKDEARQIVAWSVRQTPLRCFSKIEIQPKSIGR